MFRKTWNYLNSFEFGTPDPITAKLPFVGTPWQAFLINAAYLLFVFKLGPKFMRNRPAYELKNVLLIYNAMQVLMNLGMVVLSTSMIFYYHVYDLRCMAILADDHPLKNIEIACFYSYYIIKFIDFLDTIFFVLRKSTRQITFLHVYHHSIMAACGYLYMRYNGVGGHIASMGILNSIVHCFMYFYYFMSAFSPAMKSSIWWKKYITRLQLVQFLLIILHNLYPLLFVPNCNSPKIVFYFVILQGFIMLYLFGTFYIRTYMKSKNTKSKTIKNK